MDVYQGLGACCCCYYLWTAGMRDELDVVWADGNKVHERSVYQHRPTHPHNPKNSQRNTTARLFVRKWLHLKSSQKLQWTFCGSSLRSTRPTPPLIIKLVSFFVIILPWNGGEGENFAGINSMAWAAGRELGASVSRGGGGPGQAHRRHHQVIVMVRVAYRLFPWCSIALCNCIDHHIVTGTEKRSKKYLQARLAALLAFPASLLPHRRGACHREPLDATCLWGCYLLIALLQIIALCWAVFRDSGLLNCTVVQQCAFQGTLVDGKIYGRGAQDMKSVGVQVNLVYLLWAGMLT